MSHYSGVEMIAMGQALSRVPRREPDAPGWDRGRKLLSVAKLSGGGALIASSLVSLLAGIAGKNLPDSAEIAVAILGGVTTFVTLTVAFHIFDNDRA
jgi:hypothetical protein